MVEEEERKTEVCHSSSYSIVCVRVKYFLVFLPFIVLGHIACAQCTRCGMLLQMSHIAWSLSLSLCVCVTHLAADTLWVQGTMY